jgi:hypothetical protein
MPDAPGNAPAYEDYDQYQEGDPGTPYEDYDQYQEGEPGTPMHPQPRRVSKLDDYDDNDNYEEGWSDNSGKSSVDVEDLPPSPPRQAPRQKAPRQQQRQEQPAPVSRQKSAAPINRKKSAKTATFLSQNDPSQNFPMDQDDDSDEEPDARSALGAPPFARKQSSRGNAHDEYARGPSSPEGRNAPHPRSASPPRPSARGSSRDSSRESPQGRKGSHSASPRGRGGYAPEKDSRSMAPSPRRIHAPIPVPIPIAAPIPVQYNQRYDQEQEQYDTRHDLGNGQGQEHDPRYGGQDQDPYYADEQGYYNEQGNHEEQGNYDNGDHDVYKDDYHDEDEEQPTTTSRSRQDDSVSYTLSAKHTRRTMNRLVICLGLSLVALAALGGGLVGALIKGSDDSSSSDIGPLAATPTPAPVSAGIPSPTEPTGPTPSPPTPSEPTPPTQPTAPVVPVSPPTPAPAPAPTLAPVVAATPGPTLAPVVAATPGPTPAPTVAPTLAPTVAPTSSPSASPVAADGFVVTDQVLFDMLSSTSSGAAERIRGNATPQNEAYFWLEGSANVASFDDSKKIQRFAMATLFFSTDGPNSWSDSGVWATDIDECQWSIDGSISCAGGVLTTIEFDNNNLMGPLPPEIGLLTGLTQFSIKGDPDSVNPGLSGGIPSEIGELVLLDGFVLTNHDMTEPLPTEIGQLSLLSSFNLNDNGIPGPIPAEIGNLALVGNFNLAQNNFDGPIPTTVGQLLNCAQFNVGQNLLSGDIPTEIGNMVLLKGLYLNNNDLRGSIPSEIGNLVNIKGGLDFSNNGLTGNIPVGIGNMPGIKSFRVAGNDIEGELPEDMAGLKNLRDLYIQRNNIVGVIPTALCTELQVDGASVLADCAEITCICCSTCCDDSVVDQECSII